MFNCKTSCPNKYIAGEEDRERLYVLERECFECVKEQLRGAEEDRLTLDNALQQGWEETVLPKNESIAKLKSIVEDMLQKGFLPCPGEYGLQDYSNEHGLCEKILVISDENVCEVCWNKALRRV